MDRKQKHLTCDVIQLHVTVRKPIRDHNFIHENIIYITKNTCMIYDYNYPILSLQQNVLQAFFLFKYVTKAPGKALKIKTV